MPSSSPHTTAVGLWVVALLGAVGVLIGPLTPWVMRVEIASLFVCLTAAAGLVVWFLRD